MKHPFKQIGLKHLDWVGLALTTDLPHFSKSIIMYLGRYMNKDQEVAWPSLTRISSELSISRAALAKHLNIIESEGWITRERGTPAKSTRYYISFPRVVEQGLAQINAKGSPPHGLGSPPDGLGVVHQVDTNSQLNKPTNNNGQNEFDLFWKTYPKKVKRKDALRIWVKRKLYLKLEIICTDVNRRKDIDPQWKNGYIPDPTTYLNGERWNDEPGVETQYTYGAGAI